MLEVRKEKGWQDGNGLFAVRADQPTNSDPVGRRFRLDGITFIESMALKSISSPTHRATVQFGEIVILSKLRISRYIHQKVMVVHHRKPSAVICKKFSKLQRHKNRGNPFQYAKKHLFPAETKCSFTVISREDILSSLNTDTAEAFNIVVDGDIVGGVVVQIDKESGHNSLDLLFIDPAIQGKNIGCTVWKMIEEKYPETKIWETHTPYFEIRNIHFYVNKCGFHIVEFFNPKHPDPHEANTPGGELFFRFEKQMKQT